MAAGSGIPSVMQMQTLEQSQILQSGESVNKITEERNDTVQDENEQHHEKQRQGEADGAAAAAAATA